MVHGLTRRIPLAVAVLCVATAAGGWALWAAPAGASATFSPELAQVEQPAVRAASAESAPYTLRKASAKKATRIVKARVSTRSMRSSKAAGTSRSSSRSSGSSLSKARSILAAQVAKHPILKGTTVSFGDARGYQAIAYYGSGRIVISPNHKASLERIIAHEVWHIIDWRDNGKIDWGENIPR